MTMTAAIKEAYASMPGGDRLIETIDFDSASFPAALRFANSVDDDISLPLVLAGSPVVFTAVPFEFVLPGTSPDGPGKPKLRVKDPTGAMTQYLELASQGMVPIMLTYRVYLSSDLTQPGDVFDKIYVLNVTQSSDGTVEGELSFREISMQAFPRSTYDASRFASLQES